MTKKQKSSAVYKKTKSKGAVGLINLFWLILSLAIAVLLAIAVYFSPLADDYRNGAKVEIVKEQPVEPMIQQKPEPVATFDFYEALPKQDFRSIPEGVSVQDTTNQGVKIVSPDAVVERKVDASSELQLDIVEENATYDGDEMELGTTYILQVKSYLEAKDADEKRAEVIMAGVDAVVVRRLDKTKDITVYQVVSVPMSSREASEALHRLRNNGIDAIKIEQRHK